MVDFRLTAEINLMTGSLRHDVIVTCFVYSANAAQVTAGASWKTLVLRVTRFELLFMGCELNWLKTKRMQ